jgi:hypothetical protein
VAVRNEVKRKTLATQQKERTPKGKKTRLREEKVVRLPLPS